MWYCLFEDISEMDKADTELALERQEVAEQVIEALHVDADEPVLTTSMSENELDLDLELDNTCRSNEQPTFLHSVNGGL